MRQACHVTSKLYLQNATKKTRPFEANNCSLKLSVSVPPAAPLSPLFNCPQTSTGLGRRTWVAPPSRDNFMSVSPIAEGVHRPQSSAWIPETVDNPGRRATTIILL